MKFRLRAAAGGLCLSAVLAVMLFGGGCRATPAVITVRINEISSAGGADWVELYNYGTVPVDLDGCFLSDEADSPAKCRLPNISLPAGGYCTLTEGDTHGAVLSFGIRATGETLYLSDPRGGNLQTLAVPAIPSGLSYGCAADGAYVFFAAPTPASDNAGGMQLGTQAVNSAVGVRINECQTVNRSTLYDESGAYPDWVELYNAAAHTVDISGWTLTDSVGETVRWAFPQGTVLAPDTYLLVFCDGRDTVTASGELHTAFSLGRQDEFLGLYTADGIFASGLTLPDLTTGRSYGLTAADAAVCAYPTPGYRNAAAAETEVTAP